MWLTPDSIQVKYDEFAITSNYVFQLHGTNEFTASYVKLRELIVFDPSSHSFGILF